MAILIRGMQTVLKSVMGQRKACMCPVSVQISKGKRGGEALLISKASKKGRSFWTRQVPLSKRGDRRQEIPPQNRKGGRKKTKSGETLGRLM